MNGTTDDCEANIASGVLSAGTYACFVATTTFSGVECGAQYWAQLECGPRCRADFDQNDVINAADVSAFLSQYFIDVAGGSFGG